MKALFPEKRIVRASDIYCGEDYSRLRNWLAKEGYEVVPLTLKLDPETGWFEAKVMKKEPDKMTILRVVEYKPDEPTIAVDTINSADYVGYALSSDYAILISTPCQNFYGFVYAEDMAKAVIRRSKDLSDAMKFRARDPHASIRKALTSASGPHPRMLLCSDSLSDLIRTLKSRMVAHIRSMDDC